MPILLMVVTAVLSGCSAAPRATVDDAPAPTASPSPIDSVPPPSARTTPAPPSEPPPSEAPIANPAPDELIGLWTGTIRGSTIALRIEPGTFTITGEGQSADGRIDVIGDEITFHSTRCEGRGTYTWTIDDGQLTFSPLNDDPCARAYFLQYGTYEK